MFNNTKRNIKRSGTLNKISNILSHEKLEDTSEDIFNYMQTSNYKKIIVKRPSIEKTVKLNTKNFLSIDEVFYFLIS